MNQKLSTRETLALGFFMFAIFLGAGNLIFPPLIGQQAGELVWPAIIGFLVTGVGLPVLAIITISISGNLDVISRRVHPLFAIIFPITIYLSIGPFFGIPRTATVVYEIGVVPFLTQKSEVSLFIATLVFFSLTYWLALNPAKLVDRVGKLITPVLFLLIVIIAIRGFVTPIGEMEKSFGNYKSNAFFNGFLDGFLTMDAIAALVFGLVVIHRIQDKGIKKAKEIRSNTIKAGLIAGVGLSFVYITLAYIGATSVNAIGLQDNGGAILSSVTSLLFGSFGTIILSLVITGACLTTSIGLVSACGEFLTERFKKLSYPFITAVICLFSLTMANLGLSQLISVSLPVLITIYPIAIVLIALSLVHAIKKIPRSVYIGAIFGTFMISVYDGLLSAGFEISSVSTAFAYLPFYSQGIGWLLPSVVGGLVGLLVGKRSK